jgi:hypothetical protein
LPSYKLQFTDDFERRRLYGPLPPDVAAIIKTGLEELLEDPWEVSRIPEYSFPKIGRLFHVQFRYANDIYTAYFFFHIDDEAQSLIVRRAMMVPRFLPPERPPTEPARRILSR